MKLRDLKPICAICRKGIRADDVIHQDHIIPKKRNGPSEPWNLRVVHSACNLRKSDTIEVVQIPMLYYGPRKRRQKHAPRQLRETALKVLPPQPEAQLLSLEIEELRQQVTLEYLQRLEQVVFMRDVQHLSFEAIGSSLGVTKQRAWKIYQKAKA